MATDPATGDTPGELTERDIVESAQGRSRQRLSVESAQVTARNRLLNQIGDNGDNMYTLLMRLITQLLADSSDGVVDRFEEHCRLAKQGHFFHPESEVRGVPGAEHDDRVELAKRVLRYVKILEEFSVSTVSTISVSQLLPVWSQIGLALPPSVDYFIDRKMEMLCAAEGVRQVRFWGVIHGVSADYYILEVERDNLEALRMEFELDAEKSQIARVVIDGLIRETVSDDGSLVLDWCVAESMAMEMFERILEAAIPPDTDDDLARAVAVPVMDALLEEAVDEAQEPEVELSVMGSLDVVSCSATVDSSELSLNRVKFVALSTLLEVKLNVFQYVVSRDPFQEDWVTLPAITLDKIKASRDTRTYFGGNLDTSEQVYLRAVLTRISMDRLAGCPPPEDSKVPRLLCNRDVTVYYKATEFPREDWSVRELPWEVPRTVWRQSPIWPGSFAYGTDHVYFGWGQEKI